MILLYFSVETQTKLFHPLTDLKHIGYWIQTVDRFSNETFMFYDNEQAIILDENEVISAVSSSLSGILDDETMTIHLSYENKTETIRLLKSILTSNLLNNEQYFQQLNVQIPSNECILVQIINDDNKILSNEELQQPLQVYSSSNNLEPHFRIAILIQIIQYDNNHLYSIPIPSRNLTIEELIQMIPNDQSDTYTYLSSFQRHVVLSNNTNLQDLNETKFHLINENQICSISISNAQNTVDGRFAIFATIGDICGEHEDFIGDKSLRFNRNFVLAPDTCLTCFQHLKSTVDFNLYGRQELAHVTITNDEQPEFILKFDCLPSIELDVLSQVAFQLFNVRPKFYDLIEIDGTPLEDDSLSLDDVMDSFDDPTKSLDNVQLKLINKASIQCLITYDNQTIKIPTNNETSLQTIFQEALEKFHIPLESMNEYQFSLLDIDDIDLEPSISDYFDDEPTEVTIKLSRK